MNSPDAVVRANAGEEGALLRDDVGRVAHEDDRDGQRVGQRADGEPDDQRRTLQGQGRRRRGDGGTGSAVGELFLKHGIPATGVSTNGTMQTVESLRRENGNLTAELRDMTNELGEGGRAEAELHKLQRRVDIERDELNVRFFLLVL